MKLILKLFLFFILCFTIITILLIYFGGEIDSFYEKFTTPKTSSMIIGDSRSLEGIKPSIIDKRLKELDFELPILNYSFTIGQTPIGPLYTKSILKKLNLKAKNGLFIISISPIMLTSKNDNNNYKGEFAEDKKAPHNMTLVNVNPNYEYFFKNINNFHFKALFRKKLILHKDGWLEDNNLPKTINDYNERRQAWLDSYESFINNSSFSKYRLTSLDTLIKKLKSYGKVYLVRMPVDKIFLPLEERIYPNFDVLIDSLTKINDIKYYSYAKGNLKNEYKTLDGVHLNKYSSIIFTQNLCDSILRNYKTLK